MVDAHLSDMPRSVQTSDAYKTEKRWTYVYKGSMLLSKIYDVPVRVEEACRKGGANLVRVDNFNDRQCILKLY